jgi:hypothetical protein
VALGRIKRPDAEAKALDVLDPEVALLEGEPSVARG